ncbi:hypothetical protein [Parasphingorhabdus sp.]|uniref:hypothetical protein n=1 Tax=Parasphingorhabdus sp. TaxID=2709688 RepID=UPI0030035B01
MAFCRKPHYGAAMDSIRALIRNHVALAAVLLAAALLLKILVPNGYMVSTQNMVLTVTICADSTGEQIERRISIPMEDSDGQHQSSAKGECPYTALTMSGVTGPGMALLALAIAYILARGLAPLQLGTLLETARLRPPLRGPPEAA